MVNAASYLTFKMTHFANENLGRPDFASSAVPSTVLGTHLDTTALDTQGRFTVPQILAGQDAYNAFVSPLVNQYGYDSNGTKTGGGIVGYGLDSTTRTSSATTSRSVTTTRSTPGARARVPRRHPVVSDAEDLLRRSNSGARSRCPAAG